MRGFAGLRIKERMGLGPKPGQVKQPPAKPSRNVQFDVPVMTSVGPRKLIYKQ